MRPGLGHVVADRKAEACALSLRRNWALARYRLGTLPFGGSAASHCARGAQVPASWSGPGNCPDAAIRRLANVAHGSTGELTTHEAMSDLPSTADIRPEIAPVSFVPFSDLGRISTLLSTGDQHAAFHRQRQRVARFVVTQTRGEFIDKSCLSIGRNLR